MDYNYNYNKPGVSTKKKFVAALVIAFVVLLAINVAMFAVFSSTLKALIEGDIDTAAEQLEEMLDGKIDGAMSDRLTTTISEQIAESLVDEISQSATLAVMDTVTDELIDNYKREYNLPENYAGIGVIVAAEVGSVLELEATGNLNAPYQNQTTSSQSSAFIINTDGYVITNAHCVTYEAGIYEYNSWLVRQIGSETKVYTSIMANFKGSTQQYEMEVVAYDVDKDLAVIKFVTPPANLQPVVFGDSDLLSLGEEVAAIGNAQGLGISLTTGVVSNPPQAYQDVKVIQTDTTINPGNSGGPLFNIYGEFIGVVSFKIIESELNEGLGFAIASNSVKEYIESVETQKSITINYLEP
ncbi:MAG: trypsin-like peptidase domain-containing protein [Clostridia bacterium]|nr:trypsin-like peptidase domain-containing protein [Clostridia bacterium]